MPMSSFMPLTETQSMIFDITKLHQKYWRTFCDVYYVHLGFETEEVHSYEQKYETFCRRKSVSEEKDYEEKLLYVKIERFGLSEIVCRIILYSNREFRIHSLALFFC